MFASAAKAESGVFGASRSLSLLLLLARFASGSARLGGGNFDGGGIAVALPLELRAGWMFALFSLSDENDAAGDGESEAGFSTRRLSLWISSSLSDASRDESTARRAILRRDRGIDESGYLRGWWYSASYARKPQWKASVRPTGRSLAYCD